MARGRFIVFEGLDGSGTSTQTERLRAYLSERGVAVGVTREPTTGPLGAVIRQAIEGRISLDPTALALAFAADRADHLFNPVNGLNRALDDGTWVISDRYVLSSLAYQALATDDPLWLTQINRFAPAPDLTVFLDAPVAVCAARIGGRSGNDELFHGADTLRRVDAAYRRVLADDKLVGRLVTVDGAGSVDDVARAYRADVDALIEQSGG